jgi:diguanylate cyclase (GGDEF)-like protein
MSEISVYIAIADEKLKNCILKIASDIIPFQSDMRLFHSIILSDSKGISKKLLTKFLDNNLVIMFFENDKPAENNNLLLLKKEFLYENMETFKNILTFLKNIYSNFINHCNEVEEKLFHLAISATNVLEQNETFSEKMSKDGLTGLYNHSSFQDRLKELFENYKTNKEIFSIALLDLDFFKMINDKYGHLKGDEVLRVFAGEISKMTRKTDFAARYGGEEFIIILPLCDKELAYKIIERLREDFSKVTFKSENEEFTVTFSAGIAEISDEYDTPQSLIKAADIALYASKHSGRNRITLA